MNGLQVIGIGNPDRGDDAAGVHVLAALAQDPPPGARLGTGSGDLLALLERWRPDESVILADAMAPADAPGRIVRFDARETAIKVQPDSFASSHAFNLAETVELARALGRLPQRLIVFGIEAASCEPGAALSAPVARAVPEVARLIRQECAACMKPR